MSNQPKRSKFARAVTGGLLFAFYFMCFVFPVSLVMSFSDHTPIGQFLGQMVVNFFVLWLFCGMIAHSVIGMFDDMNKPRSDDNDPNRDRNPNLPQDQLPPKGEADRKDDQDNGHDGK